MVYVLKKKRETSLVSIPHQIIAHMLKQENTSEGETVHAARGFNGSNKLSQRDK